MQLGFMLDILSSDMEKAAEDIERIWEPGIWDANHMNSRIPVGDKMVGASLALWGEYAAEIEATSVSTGLSTDRKMRHIWGILQDGNEGELSDCREITKTSDGYVCSECGITIESDSDVTGRIVA